MCIIPTGDRYIGSGVDFFRGGRGAGGRPSLPPFLPSIIASLDALEEGV